MFHKSQLQLPAILFISLNWVLPEFSIHNPGALLKKSLSKNIDFLNSAPGVVYRKLRYCMYTRKVIGQLLALKKLPLSLPLPRFNSYTKILR